MCVYSTRKGMHMYEKDVFSCQFTFFPLPSLSNKSKNFKLQLLSTHVLVSVTACLNGSTRIFNGFSNKRILDKSKPEKITRK